jgi:hypothetical protein
MNPKSAIQREFVVLKLYSLVLSVLVLAFWAAPVGAAVDVSYERALVERVQAAFGHDGDPGDYTEDAALPMRCGTPLILEIKAHWSELTVETQRLIAAIVQVERPILDEYYDTPDGLFRLHFNRSGEDSVDMDHGVGEGNVPVYVLSCAELLSEVVAKEIDDLGFRMPGSDDATDPSGDPRYDIYFQNLGILYYGFTVPEHVYFEPGEPSARQTSWMVLHSDFEQIQQYRIRPFDAMAVTLAHEFHHASQWMYDAFEPEIRNDSVFSWFLEASATAMEEVVFDDINDYVAYLDAFFDFPWVSLRDFSFQISDPLVNHPYASCIWILYLIQKTDEHILREIWEVCGETPGFNTFAAFESALAARNSSLAAEWAEFLVWNYFTGDRAVSWGYEEGLRYPEIDTLYVPEYDSVPMFDTTESLGFPKSVDEFGAQYLRFIPPLSDTSITFRLKFTPQPEFEGWMVVTAGLVGWSQPRISYTQDVASIIEYPNWDQVGVLLVILTPYVESPHEEVLTRRLGYSFAVADTITRSTISLKAYPNPFIITNNDAMDSLTIKVDRERRDESSTRVLDGATVHIYTVDGRLIVGGKADSHGSNRLYLPPDEPYWGYTLKWNGRNRDGQPVASGVYLALVQVGGEREILKIAVKNEVE